MARSKPQTTFTITYGGVNQNTAPDSLTPVFIAPRYDIHAAEYDNATFADSTGNTVYSGAAISGAYPKQTSGAILDAASVSAYIVNPAVKLGDSNGAAFTGTAETTNGPIVFASAVAGQASFLQGGYNLQRGDKLVSGSTVYNITSVGQATTQAAATITSTSSAGSWAATYTGTVPAVYVLTAISSAAAAGTATMMATAVNGDLSYQNQQVAFVSHGSAVVGNLGLVVSRVASAIDIGASLIISCTPGGTGIYNSVFVDASLTSGAAITGLKAQTTNFITGSALISPADVTAGTSEAIIAADASCVYGSQTYPIASGTVELNYRELLTEDANELQAASAPGIEDWVGPMVPENPLGMAYNAAIQTGYNNFYLCATADASDAAINEAMTAAAKVEDVYSLVPLIQTPSTISTMQALIAKYSDKKVAQVKRGWIFSQQQKNTALLTAVGTIAGNTITGIDADEIAEAGIVIGDNAIVTAYDSTLGKTTKTVMKITGISGSTITVADAPISGSKVISFSRTATPTDLAKAIAAEASQYNSPRINYIYAEPNTVAGYAFDNAQYITVVLAMMRGSMPPHAPLTDVTIPGVSISTSVGFSESDLDIMNNGGVWVCYRDNRGDMVTRHAITTGGVGTIAEEDSAVSNGDNILRTVRNQVSWLRGNCNVTPALIDKIYVNVQAAFNTILARNYSDLIGPQILEVESITVKQDPNNTAGVIGVFNLDLPDVYLNGDFTFNLF